MLRSTLTLHDTQRTRTPGRSCMLLAQTVYYKAEVCGKFGDPVETASN